MCLATLVSVSPTACGANVSVEPACDTAATSGQECAAACEAQNPTGLDYYNVVMVTCACSGCSDACVTSVCDEQQTPSDACLPCVQQALAGPPCNEHAGLFGSGCLGYDECASFVACLLACDP